MTSTTSTEKKNEKPYPTFRTTARTAYKYLAHCENSDEQQLRRYLANAELERDGRERRTIYEDSLGKFSLWTLHKTSAKTYSERTKVKLTS